MTRRAYYWPVLIIGIIMIIAPFAMSMPSKAANGQRMLNNFHPIMQQASVNETLAYYNNTFKPLQQVAVGGIAAAGEENSMMMGLATALHMTPTQMSKFLVSSYPAMGTLLQSFPQLVPVFKNVTPGLNFYKPLVDTMSANVKNYASVDSLPNFNLFTWFFVVPGVLIVLFALMGLGLFTRREKSESKS